MEYIAPIASTAGATVKILEFAFRVTNVKNEIADYLRIIGLVEADLNEAIRLRNLYRSRIGPPALTHIDSVILSTKSGIQSVNLLVEGQRVDVEEKGTVGVGNRLVWVFKNSNEMESKSRFLSACHGSLLSVVNGLNLIERSSGSASGEGTEEDRGGCDEREVAELMRKYTVTKMRTPGGRRGGGGTEGTAYRERSRGSNQQSHSSSARRDPPPQYQQSQQPYSQQQPHPRPSSHNHSLFLSPLPSNYPPNPQSPQQQPPPVPPRPPAYTNNYSNNAWSPTPSSTSNTSSPSSYPYSTPNSNSPFSTTTSGYPFPPISSQEDQRNRDRGYDSEEDFVAGLARRASSAAPPSSSASSASSARGRGRSMAGPGGWREREWGEREWGEGGEGM
ncbi:MAG: hypothetical protein M1840_002116 [Geoglossum simile]|nr:MAG: hypothetical protein M1840_002116 [Geoglossum simile]